MKCPSCGAELEKDARFCHICGQPVPAAGEESRFCIRCGLETIGRIYRIPWLTLQEITGGAHYH